MRKFIVPFIAPTLFVLFGPAARADARPPRGAVAHVAVCEAILNVVRPAPASNTLGSLRDVSHLMRVTYPPPGPVGADDGQYDVDATLGRIRARLVPDGIAQHALVAARLVDIERDITAPGTHAITIGREFRGFEAIDRERRALSDRTERTHERIQPFLDTLYSQGDLITRGLKWGTVVLSTPPLAMLLVGAVPPAVLWGPLLGLPVLGVRVAGRALARWSALNAGFDRHVRRIGRALRSDAPNFLMMGGSVEVPIELYRALADDNTVRISHDRALHLAEVTKQAGRMVSATPGTLTRMQTRELRYDSIFYTDPATNEPVWLVYLRAVKPALPDSSPPRVPQAKAVGVGRPWIPAALPQGS